MYGGRWDQFTSHELAVIEVALMEAIAAQPLGMGPREIEMCTRMKKEVVSSITGRGDALVTMTWPTKPARQ